MEQDDIKQIENNELTAEEKVILAKMSVGIAIILTAISFIILFTIIL